MTAWLREDTEGGCDLFERLPGSPAAPKRFLSNGDIAMVSCGFKPFPHCCLAIPSSFYFPFACGFKHRYYGVNFMTTAFQTCLCMFNFKEEEKFSVLNVHTLSKHVLQGVANTNVS